MKQQVLVTQDANEIQVAVLEDSVLEEFYIEREDSKKLFGNIYKGVVKTVIPGIDASFIDLGTGKDGFLYVADAMKSPVDLDAEFEDSKPKSRIRRRPRHNRIDEVLKVGQEIIVQVVKESIRNKGPRLTTQFSIPARYLVMMPGDEKIGISKRIDDRAERDRIRKIFDSLDIPKGVGFIVRTNAEGKSEEEFKRDIRYLLQLWKKIHSSIEGKKGPTLIHQELSLVERVVRDYVTQDDVEIIIDHEDLYKQMKKFCSLYMPGQRTNIKFVKEKGRIFEEYHLEKEIDKTYNRTVPLKSGGSIVIEQTEGLVAIDVNTGKFTGTKNLEETVYKTNIEAAHTIARQLRLRDAGGIIIIDFIDMEKFSHRKNLWKLFNDKVKKDRAKTQVLKMNDFGLIEMTRQRIRPSLESAVYESCPYCKGKGMIKSATTMTIQTIKELRKAIRGTSAKVINAYLNPDVADRLYYHDGQALKDLEKATRRKIYVHADSSAHREDINISFVK